MIGARGDQDHSGKADQASREKEGKTGDVVVKVSGAAEGLASGQEATAAKCRSEGHPACKANEPPGSTGPAPQEDGCAEKRKHIHQCDDRQLHNVRLFEASY